MQVQIDTCTCTELNIKDNTAPELDTALKELKSISDLNKFKAIDMKCVPSVCRIFLAQWNFDLLL